MTYDEFMQNIIDTRGQWNIPDGEYFEIHHIIPKCMGGEPKYIYKAVRNHKNLIWLYAHEHFIAHKLLCEKYEDSIKLKYAYLCMAYLNGGNLHRDELSEQEYEDVRKRQHELRGHIKLSEETKTKIRNSSIGHLKTIGSTGQHWFTDGEKDIMCFDNECPDGFYRGVSKKVSEETRNKLREHRVGKKLSEETKLKISISSQNRTVSDETREKHKEAVLGIKNPRYGKHLTDEEKNHLSELNSGKNNHFYGKKHSDDARKKMSDSRIGKYVNNHWYNNGVSEVFCIECPDGYCKGRLKKKET